MTETHTKEPISRSYVTSLAARISISMSHHHPVMALTEYLKILDTMLKLRNM